MADPTLADLRRELVNRSDVEVPMAPIAAMVARAEQVSRARSRRLLVGVAAGIVTVIGLGVAIAGGSGPDERIAPSDRPTSTSTDAPPEKIKSLEDLPQGRPSDLIHLRGRTLYLGGKTVTLPRRPTRMLPAGSTAVVQYDDFSIDAVDVLDGGTRKISGKGSGIPVVGPGGWIAYAKPGTGKNPVVVVDTIEQETPSAAREATFPVEQSCCDNPFQLYGISQSGTVIGGTPMSGDFTWVTRHDGLGGLPGEPTKLFGPGDRRVVDVTEVEIVVTGPAGIEVGQLVDGQGFVPNDRFELDGEADYAIPSSVLLMNGDGLIRVRERTHQVRSPRSPAHEVVLNLPALREFPGVHWENYPNDDGRLQVVLDVSAYSSGLSRDAQVRCDVTTGDCEIASWYGDFGVTLELQPQSGGVNEDDLDLVRDLFAIAQVAGPEAGSTNWMPTLVKEYPFAPQVGIGNGFVLREVAPKDLWSPEGWRSDAAGFAGRDGRLSVLDQLRGFLALSSDSTRSLPLHVLLGEQPRCAGGKPLRFPEGEGLRKVSIEPANPASCLDWFSIGIFSANGKVTAVTLDLYEP